MTLMMAMEGSSSTQHTHHSNSSRCNNNGVLRHCFVIGLVLISYATLQIFYSQGMNGIRQQVIANNLATTTTTTTTTTIAASSDTTPARGFSLAYEQSYGFFADIPDEEWKMHQEKARQHRHHRGNPLQFWSPNTPASMLYYYNYEPLFTCPHVRRVGGPGDGPKWTCDPHRIVRIAKEEQQRQQQRLLPLPQKEETPSNTTINATTIAAPCLVYSIGSAGFYVWEDGLYESFGPNICEFHIFDPGHFDRPALNAQRNMHYHPWGITSSYHPNPKSHAHEWGKVIVNGTFMTLDESMRLLNHTNRTIELLKADCEYCEWFSYQDWIRYGNVRQLMIETHHLPMPKTVPDVWPWPPTNMTPDQFFNDLQDANYIMFSKEPNIHQNNKGSLVEWSFIRLHPDFLHGP